MAELVADFLARRMREEHGLTGPATMEQLLDICAARACPVEWTPLLIRRGYYIVHTDVPPFILLRSDATPHVLAHELYHHLVHDNEEHGVIYSFPDCEVEANPDGELMAERFAYLLCSRPE